MPGQYLLTLPSGVRLDGARSFEKVMDDRIAEVLGDDAAAPPPPDFDPPPEMYDTSAPGDWPLRLNLRCSSCTLPIPETPHMVPFYMDLLPGSDGREGGRLCFHRRKEAGVTCSVACAVTWIEDHLAGEEASQARELLSQLYYARYQARAPRLVAAPRHTELVTYGGKLTVAQFQEKLARLAPRAPPAGRLPAGGDAAPPGAPDAWSLGQTPP